MYATICAKIFHIACHITVSSNARPRLDYSFGCSCRHARWINVREYPLSTPPPFKSFKIKRAHSHRTMEGWAAKGKCTMGWLYGSKLHILINNRVEIIQWTLTPGNLDDCELLKDKDFTQWLFGEIFADRGYIR